VIKAGRSLAATAEWKKLPSSPVAAASQTAGSTLSHVVASAPASEVATDTASIQESLNLSLVEVANPQWKNDELSKFSGALVTNNGVIESLNASLGDGKNIDISFSEMTGNTFEYDYNGEVFTGMMYQVDMNAYMISLSNGPLEGTRMRFSGQKSNPETQAEESQNYLAENHNVEIGNFGEESAEPVAEATAQATPVDATEAPAFKF
jgi:hypothetical protein